MRRQLLGLAALAAPLVSTQSTTTANPSVALVAGTSSTGSAITAYTDTNTGLPTGSQYTYLSYNTTRVLVTSTTSRASNGTESTISATDASSAQTLTYLAGSTAGASNATSTTSSSGSVNTQPCNGHADFCNRKYSNVTMLAAHNFCFVKPGNAASNQIYGGVDGLNNGIRMLQGATSDNNGTMSYCHTSCNLLNAGTCVDQWTQIALWVAAHPYDVVTLLIGNSDFVPVVRYVQPLTDSGLLRYAYQPRQIPMTLAAWPTLGDMILSQKRVVIFIDYNADQTKVPYILDEFSQMWETPFSPTDPAFPCDPQRPPDLSDADAANRLYMANHNLNTNVDLLGFNILVPNTAVINTTNAVSGNSSLGDMAQTCRNQWNRAPNFLLVDYYNYGNFPGSVFKVAADYNGVAYTAAQCCGSTTSGAASTRSLCSLSASVFAFIAIFVSSAVLTV